MKQEEKNKRSREAILTCAFTEFGQRGYSGASVNTICAQGHISKGLLYHYYADKDALYLACLERCFRELTEYLSGRLEEDTVTADQYFKVRLTFFGRIRFIKAFFGTPRSTAPPISAARYQPAGLPLTR